MLKEIARGLLDLVLPPLCAGCGAQIESDTARGARGPLAAVLCPTCHDSLDVLGPDRCPRCQAEVSSPAAATPCGTCSLQSSPLVSCVASVVYRDAAEAWIRRFKYPEPGLAFLRPESGVVVAAMITEVAEQFPGLAPTLVMPIPLHPRRLRARGFNPAAVLAHAIARHTGAQFSSGYLVRIRDTPSQTRLSRSERQRNVRGAFARTDETRLPERVWLVDDVVTTGSTLEEAARTLGAGADIEIHAICAGRAGGRTGGKARNLGANDAVSA